MSFLKIRAEEEDLRKWKERATAAGMDFSKWVRAMLNMASVENKAGAVPPTKKISEDAPPPTEQRTRPRGSGPIKRIEDVTYPAIRKHIPESGGTRAPGGKCTYLPVAGTVCRHCKKVHPVI